MAGVQLPEKKSQWQSRRRHGCIIRDFTHIRRQGQRVVNYLFSLYFRISHLFRFIQSVCRYFKTCYECVHFQIEIGKINCCGSRSPENAEFSHFTLLFCRGRRRNVKGIITCTAIFLLIKPFVWWHMTGRFKRKAKTNNWTKTSPIFRRKQAHKLTWQASPHANIFSSLCTYSWARLHELWFMCSCLRVLPDWFRACSHGWRVPELIGLPK